VRKFTALILMLAVFTASLVNSAYAGVRYEHQQAHLAQAAHTHCATIQAHGGKADVSSNHSDEHGGKSGKVPFKSLCEIACHAPVMVQAHAGTSALANFPVVSMPFYLAQGLLPSWLLAVPDQPPKYS
jgi:hypothetical protein